MQEVKQMTQAEADALDKVLDEAAKQGQLDAGQHVAVMTRNFMAKVNKTTQEHGPRRKTLMSRCTDACSRGCTDLKQRVIDKCLCFFVCLGEVLGYDETGYQTDNDIDFTGATCAWTDGVDGPERLILQDDESEATASETDTDTIQLHPSKPLPRPNPTDDLPTDVE